MQNHRAPWDRLHRHVVRVGPDLPVTVYTPADQPDLNDPEVIFLPGIASDGRCWHRQSALSKNRRIAFMDIPMEVPEAPYTFDILALLLRDAVRQLCSRPPVLVGASFGGMLALRYALEYPDAVSALVLVGTSCDSRWFIWPFRTVYETVQLAPPTLFSMTFSRLCALTALADGQDLETADLYRTQAASMLPMHYANRVHAIGRLRLLERLEEILTPALVVHGTLDHTIPVHIGRRLATRLPCADLQVLSGGTHSMYLRHSPWFNDVVECWLDGLQGFPSLRK